MADRSLRLLARRASQGDRDAESRLLLERVRRGGLSVEGLRFAAYLGHEPSRAALGDRAPRVPEDLGAWTTKLRRWGRWNCVHAAMAVVARLLEKAPDPGLQTAFRVAWSWLRCPCLRHTREAQDRVPTSRSYVCASALIAPSPWAESSFVSRESFDVARALHLTAACEEPSGWWSYGGALLAVVYGAQLRADAPALTAAEIRQAISADLLPWVHSRW